MDLYALMVALGLALLALSFILAHGSARMVTVALAVAMFAVAALRTLHVV